MKTCSICSAQKELSDFYTRGSQCKVCLRLKTKAWVAANPERVAAYYLERRNSSAEKDRASAREYRARNIEKCRARELEYSRNNAERKRENARKWAEGNRERAADKTKAWRLANPGRSNALKAAYKASKKQRVPGWVCASDLAPFYEDAVRRSELTGIPHHVDHIIPLKGRLVSGLHVPENLQVIPAAENIRKGNSFAVG